MQDRYYPVLDVNIGAIQTNAKVLCDICAQNHISVAGIIKFSDGDLEVARAYQGGGCAQLGVSRAKHLKALKECFPDTQTLLTRCPTRGDLTSCARYSDLTLIADADALTALNAEAAKWEPVPGFC